MSAPRRLRAVLARQWIGFGLLLFAGFAALALVALWMLEDSFIDARLRDVGGGVRSLDAAPALPPAFALHARAAAPHDLLERAHGQEPGAVREFRRADGRYVHVLAGRDAAGRDFLLVHDVSDQLLVNAALARALPWLLGAAALLALLAWRLAVRFVDDVARQAQAVLERMRHADAPDELQTLAGQARIHEFAELARLAAQAWGERLQALARERETLAFLGHELRTPLQSARTSLALLHEDRGNAAAWARLQRAHDRLVRASNAILWLDAGADADVPAAFAPAPTLQALVEEFAPLAAARGQSIALDAEDDLAWSLPADVAEIVLANLLLNAIQHGSRGTIAVHADAAAFTVANPVGEAEASGGFGLGLQLAARLLAPFGWALRQDETAPATVRMRAHCVDSRRPLSPPPTERAREVPVRVLPPAS